MPDTSRDSIPRGTIDEDLETARAVAEQLAASGDPDGPVQALSLLRLVQMIERWWKP